LNTPIDHLPPCPDTPNCFRTSISINKDIDSSFRSFKATLSLTGAKKISVKENSKKEVVIKAVYRIPVFGWLDDVIIKIVPSSSNREQSTVFLRSSSREGYFDLGVNKRRIKRILKKAQKELN
jgi:uncharacterized protein (DUF1499 family)